MYLKVCWARCDHCGRELTAIREAVMQPRPTSYPRGWTVVQIRGECPEHGDVIAGEWEVVWT
ncbi:MAG TPA: hypothetical protein VNO79_10615 [Actinomycetota bacterium]|nr:hypothetical protein [Actinomycetota bacterium]